MSMFLVTSISLHYTENKHNLKLGRTYSLHFAYSWGHRLKIVLTLGGNRNSFKLKTTAKLKDKRTSDATIRYPFS
jgi:hypothetical protein